MITLKIIEIIVFNSLIGNGDRPSRRTWAFINISSFFPNAIKDMESGVKGGRYEKAPKWFLWLIKKLFDFETKEKKTHTKVVELYFQKTKDFAPIYDNGSSLGRELEDHKVEFLLNNPNDLAIYVERGKSEFHWENIKKRHFEIIILLLKSSYAGITAKVIKRVIKNFRESELEKIVSDIDKSIPENLSKFKLPEARKRLIIKMVTLRYERLKALYNERV